MNTLLFQRFNFQKPIQIEELPEGEGDKLIAQQEKLIIGMDKTAEDKDLAEILAHAKMAEKDPLLGTFYFQQNLTPEELKFASMFFRLCLPLQDAWIYKILRRYAPDIYEEEIAELMGYWEILQMNIATITDATESGMRRQILSMFTILSENPANKTDLALVADDDNRADWEGYFSKLKELVHCEPKAELFLQLAEASNAPYRVKIATDLDGMRHFEIAKR